jgi:hypothetical protein
VLVDAQTRGGNMESSFTDLQLRVHILDESITRAIRTMRTRQTPVAVKNYIDQTLLKVGIDLKIASVKQLPSRDLDIFLKIA